MKKTLTLILAELIISVITFNAAAQEIKPKITFIELGSVSCIPCKKMQPIMKSLEKKYGPQLKIIFYDVWKKEHKDMSAKYNIRLIPTQIFLDEYGKEIHRHEGYYPEADIESFLQSKGLKPKKQESK